MTAAVAALAALWAKKAAEAGTKSYRSFVAAEDAFLFVEMPDGAIIESVSATGERSESYFLTAKVKNLGRSPARLHRYVVGEEVVPILKTLKQEQESIDGWRIQIDGREPFDFEIHYSTALRPDAVLTVTVQVVNVPNRHTRIAGAIVGTKLTPEV